MQTVPIAILGIIVLVIAIFFLIGVEYFYKKITEDQITQKKFFEEIKPKSIFLMGSSHIGRINATKVEEYSNLENTIYNIAIDGNHPKQRVNQLEMIIKSNPKTILYGMSYRDFQFPQNNLIITKEDFDLRRDIICNFQDYFPESPFFQIKNILTNITGMGLMEDSKQIIQSNTPFITYKLNERPLEEPDFSENNKNIFNKWNDPNRTFCEISSIKKIISEAKDNGINIILITTPLHSSYLELITNSQKDNFEVVKKYLTQKYNVKIFEFENKYSSIEDIWYDSSHLLVSKNVDIFNRDIAKILDDEQ